jgi:UDP-N-acetyl-D-galactosamine dehydrogenase
MVSEPTGKYDAAILAVSHREYLDIDEGFFDRLLSPGGVVVDVKGILRSKIKKHTYWGL